MSPLVNSVRSIQLPRLAQFLQCCTSNLGMAAGRCCNNSSLFDDLEPRMTDMLVAPLGLPMPLLLAASPF